jgi:tol-pal system protein YbgF
MFKLRKVLLIICFAPAVFALNGCLATSTEIKDLRDDIYQLQLKLNEVQSNQADIASKMDTLSTDMGSLNFELQETQNRMSLLSQRLDDVESGISQRMNKLFEQLSGTALSISPPPSELYNLAYSDFSKGRYDLAIVGFKSYLEKYPQGELAAQAQYYIGESYYSQSQWQNALDAFKAVDANFVQSDMVPAARLKSALSLKQLGKSKESTRVLESLIKDFPSSSEAFAAKEQLSTSPSNGK